MSAMLKYFAVVIWLGSSLAHAQPSGSKPIYPGSGGARPAGLWSKTAIDFDREFSKIKSATGQLEKFYGGKNAEAVKALKEIQANTGFLQGKWNQWVSRHSVSGGGYAPPTMQDKYLVSLKRLNQQLARVVAKPSDAEALGRLQDIAADLQIKADNCRNSTDGLGKEVRVKVRTLVGTEEVKGFEIYYVPKGLLDVKSEHERFRRLSSPTDEVILAPGRYAVWGKKDDRSTEPIFQRVGGQGEQRIEIDLPVK